MDTSNEIILTPQDRQALVDELEWREGEKDAEIVQFIKEARAQGDVSENSEYDAAKEEQSMNAARIAEIRSILSVARVVEEGKKKRNAGINVGDSVEVEDKKGHVSKYTIVGTTSTNSLENKISTDSPLGSALIGRKKGDDIEFVTPSGKTRKLKIVSIRH